MKNRKIVGRGIAAGAVVLTLALGACGSDGQSSDDVRERLALDDTRTAPGPVQQPSAQPPADTIDMRTIGYSRGAEDAPVTVYEFSDFGCPFCGIFARSTYPELHEEFVATGKVRWTYVPFVMGMFPNGAEAARAAECGAEQDSFWEMHDRLYEDQNEWKGSRSPEELFNGYAGEVGLDGARFESCYRENRGAERTRVSNMAASSLRIRATPSFIINGRLVEGALPVEQFRQILTMLSGQ